MKKYNNVLLIIILLLFLGQYTNFFKNLRSIFIYDYQKRISFIYGFCDKNSLGFLLHVKNKYDLKEYPEIVNYKILPNSKWVFDINGKNRSKKNSSYLILLNYEKNLTKNTLTKNKSYHQIPNSINNIGIKSIKIETNKNKDLSFDDISIKLVQSNFKNSKIIYNKNFNKVSFIDGGLEIFLNFRTNLLQDVGLKTFILIESKSIPIDIENIKIFFYNKYIIDEKKIIEKFDNCYFLKND
jgi:hypothetical protein